ncbi:hypothetical protein JT056_02670 [Helicobacter pylori]|nr:hypothetical protein [Helicobacter pylori]
MVLKLVSICYAVIILVGCSNKQYEMYKSPKNNEVLAKFFNEEKEQNNDTK